METDKTDKCCTYKCIVKLEKKIFLPLQMLVGVTLCVGLYLSAAWYWLVAICLPLEVASISVLWWPVIDPPNAVFRERALLFGKKLISERVTPLGEFVEVFYEYVPSGDRDTNYQLGLRHKSGRKFWVEGSWTIRRGVEAKAWEISCRTGIKLKEWPA